MLWNEWYHLFQDEAVSENLAAAKMKARRLKMRKDVWTRTLFSVSQWGVCMGRQVMYYLESDLPLCLIRAWLREVVTVFSPPHVKIWTSAQEWRWRLGQRPVTQLFYHVRTQTMSTVYFTTHHTLIHYLSDSCGITCSPCGAVLSANNPEHKSIGNVSGPQGAMF